jgi:glycosyltransferase involved in cell wall biosynthesis
MNILCVTECLGSGGAERQLVELSLGFQRRGHRVSFLTYHDDPFYKATLDNAGIPNNCIEEPGYTRRLLKMRRFIRDGGYDAVLSFLQSSSFICEVAGLPGRRWRLVVGERSANPNVRKHLRLRVYRWFHVLADMVVANSRANLRMVRSINPLLPDRKCSVVYNAVDLERWKPLAGYVPRRDGPFRVVVAAGHRYLKNLSGLLDALLLLDAGERSRLRIEWYGSVIDGSYDEAKRRIAREHLEDSIGLFPETHDITRAIQEADAVGLFSFYEGFPNAVCEGMACAKPVICSAVSDLPTLLSDTGNVLCDPNDPASIADALRRAIHLSDEDLRRIGAENRALAERHFAAETITSHYLEYLR